MSLIEEKLVEPDLGRNTKMRASTDETPGDEYVVTPMTTFPYLWLKP